MPHLPDLDANERSRHDVGEQEGNEHGEVLGYAFETMCGRRVRPEGPNAFGDAPTYVKH